jgi:FAD/FMN-containing dehydrogenase
METRSTQGRGRRLAPPLFEGVDREAQAFRIAPPLGNNSIAGAAAHTLSGGFGQPARKRGPTVDNLVYADATTADGEFYPP